MLRAFHFNLSALAWVALLVGLFLVYNTVAVSVIARREAIGSGRRHVGGNEPPQTGHAHHEKLVEVGAVNSQEFHALEQRHDRLVVHRLHTDTDGMLAVEPPPSANIFVPSNPPFRTTAISVVPPPISMKMALKSIISSTSTERATA